MLNCREIIALFSDFIDGEFEDEFRDDFLCHIRECPVCGCHFRTFEKTVLICNSLKDHEYLEVPRHIHDGFWEFIKTEIYGAGGREPAPARLTGHKKSTQRRQKKNG